ncbi:MAG TPA: DUF4342 domain-containing protein [Actinomycetota bacterium]
MAEDRVWTEKVKVQADALREKVEELLREGNVRRIVVKNSEGQTVIELPLTFGIVGAVAAPMITAVGAMAGVAARWSLEIERREPAGKKATPAKSTAKKSTAKKASAKKAAAKKTSAKKGTSKKAE